MIDKALFLVYNIIVVMSEDITGYMQTYRSGHNGADSKSVWEQSHEGSNPSRCARKRRDTFGCLFLFMLPSHASRAGACPPAAPRRKGARR